MRRRAPTLLAIAAALATPACGAFDDFEVELTDRISIPGSGIPFGPFVPFPYEGKLSDFQLGADKSFANQDVEPGDVDAIFVKTIEMTDSQPMLMNFKNVLEEIVLHVESPGVAKQELARGSNFPDAATVSLVVNSGLNLKPYAEAASMTISADVKIKRPPFRSFTVDTKIVLMVDINLLGT